MAQSLDDVLRGEVSNADANQSDATTDAGEANHTGEAQQTDAAAGESQAAAPEAGEHDAPPASEPAGKLVPLKALEEERKGRQDWKEKAIRFEEELKHLRENPPQAQAQRDQPVEMDVQTAILNERFNLSELLLRSKHDDADVDAKVALFQAEAAKDRTLGLKLAQQKDPYKWMYDYASRLQAMSEIGEDPAAYRERVRAEIKAEMEAAAQGQTAETPPAQVAQPAALNLPKSLATSRSAAPRSAPAWTGPSSLDNILKR